MKLIYYPVHTEVYLMKLAEREAYNAELDSSTIVCRARYLAKPEDVRSLCHAIIEAAKQVPTSATRNRVRTDIGNRQEGGEAQNFTVPLASMGALLTLDAWERYNNGLVVISGADIMVEHAASGSHLSLSLYNNETPEACMQGVEPEVLVTYEGPPPASCDGKDVKPLSLAFQCERMQPLLLHLLCNIALRDLPPILPEHGENDW